MGNLNVLVIGAGGREHALTWKIAQSGQVGKIYCAPGNAGTAAIAKNVSPGDGSNEALLKFAKENDIGLTVVGPEAPLATGIVDLFTAAGLKIFGPSKAAAQLEASKVFMKEVLTKAGVPTARYEVFTDRDEAVAALDRFDEAVVIKADGLAAGKGVIVATSRDEAIAAIDAMLRDNAFGAAGARIILEETLQGEEASILAFCDGENILMMPSSQDHKRIGDGDTGPNTGGMGAYSPAPVVTDEMTALIEKEIMRRTAAAMKEMGAPYVGILYAGLMIAPDGTIKVLEFNCRFGDPECQPIMARMNCCLVDIIKACIDGRLDAMKGIWKDFYAVCVVMAAEGYPGSYEKGRLISGIDEAEADSVVIFHAGTKKNDHGQIVTAGGRVLGVTALGSTIKEALDRAYDGVKKISWEGANYRTDIGQRALDR